MTTIKQNDNGIAVTFHGTGCSVVEVRTLEMAKDLCRVRLNKCKAHEFDKETLTIIKVPFVNLWLVW